MSVAKGEWVRLKDGKAGEVTALDGGRAQVSLSPDGNKVWRPMAECTPLFGGKPKAQAEVGDYCKVGTDVGVVASVGGGRINVEFPGGKKLWRGFADVTLEDDGRPAGAKASAVAKPSSSAPAPAPTKPSAAKKKEAAKPSEQAPADAPAPDASPAGEPPDEPPDEPTSSAKVSVTFQLPFKRERVFAELISADAPLGFDATQPGFSQEILWHGTAPGKQPDDATQLLLGCIRSSEYTRPFAGSTMSELVELDAPRRLTWRQLHSSGSMTFAGRDDLAPTTVITLESFGQGCIVDVELGFERVQLPAWLGCVGCCAAPLIQCALRQHIGRQWREEMLRRGHPTVVDAAAASVQAQVRGSLVRKQRAAAQLRIPRSAARAFLGALLERLEKRAQARGGVPGRKMDRAADQSEEDAIKAKAKARAANGAAPKAQSPSKQQQQQLASEAAEKQKLKKGFVEKGKSPRPVAPPAAPAAAPPAAPAAAPPAAPAAAPPVAPAAAPPAAPAAAPPAAPGPAAAAEQLIEGNQAPDRPPAFAESKLGKEGARVFALVDKDGSGVIDVSEMGQLKDMVLAMDEDTSGKISLDEWLGYVEKQAAKSEQRAKNMLKLLENMTSHGAFSAEGNAINKR